MSALLDKDFLKQLDEAHIHEVYARIVALSTQELPLEQIEGKVTGGSINVDGASIIRRTCSVTLTASEVNISDYYWGLHNKFTLEIGLKNNINPNYPNIIWFKQGTYVITSFSTSYTTSGYTISISGKDKMCLLNGDVGGSLTASIDFGVEEYNDLENNTVIYKSIPLKNIIKESLHTYALEPYSNIIINDLDEQGLELLEYRGDEPAYLLRDKNQGEFVQFYLSAEKCYIAKPDGSLEESTMDKIPIYDSRMDDLLDSEDNIATTIYLSTDKKTPYTVAKLEYGETAGYKLTSLTYAGDLISNIGDSLTSIYDKIVTMLGDFEYFYNLDGQFVFQRKKTYLNTSWNNIVTIDNDTYMEDSEYASSVTYSFEGNKLITSVSNSPNLNNSRNDYAIWGKRTSVSDAELSIHYRYAIHQKPESYTSLQKDAAGKWITYSTNDYDWRELIYQMALDYYKYHENGIDDVPFEVQVQRNNPLTCPAGVTGYEQFYVDMQGFWRELYNPKPDYSYTSYVYATNGAASFVPTAQSGAASSQLFVLDKYTQLNSSSEVDRSKVYKIVEYNGSKELRSLIDTIVVDYTFDEDGLSNTYYMTAASSATGYKAVSSVNAKRVEKKQLYVKNSAGKFISLLDSVLLDKNCYLKETSDIYLPIGELPTAIQPFYYNSGQYNKYFTLTALDVTGHIDVETEAAKEYINYYVQNMDYQSEGENRYWANEVIESPDRLNFWIDFLDADGGSELDRYSISMIGDRPKVINDDKVTSIYYRETPNLIFSTHEQVELTDLQTKIGYTFIYLDNVGLNDDDALEFNYFNISSQGKSAKDELDTQLYNCTYCTESITIGAVPIYYLEPNTRIEIRDQNSKIDGEYIVNKITIPLTYNGTMSIQATKAPQRIY